MLTTKDRIICCVMAVIMLWVGMCLDCFETDACFSRAANEYGQCTIESVAYFIDGDNSCTAEMMGKSHSLSFIRGTLGRTTMRWDRTILLSVLVGATLQYLLYLRGTVVGEYFEILHSDTVAVNYIHCKDGEK